MFVSCFLLPFCWRADAACTGTAASCGSYSTAGCVLDAPPSCRAAALGADNYGTNAVNAAARRLSHCFAGDLTVVAFTANVSMSVCDFAQNGHTYAMRCGEEPNRTDDAPLPQCSELRSPEACARATGCTVRDAPRASAPRRHVRRANFV